MRYDTILRLTLGALFLWVVVGVEVGAWLFAPATAQDTPDETLPRVVENATGTVTKVGNFGYGLVPDEDPGTRYAPTEPLPLEFREHDLRVRFSGVEGDPADVRGRRWGTPFEVTHIERLEAP